MRAAGFGLFTAWGAHGAVAQAASSQMAGDAVNSNALLIAIGAIAAVGAAGWLVARVVKQRETARIRALMEDAKNDR